MAKPRFKLAVRPSAEKIREIEADRARRVEAARWVPAVHAMDDPETIMVRFEEDLDDLGWIAARKRVPHKRVMEARKVVSFVIRSLVAPEADDEEILKRLYTAVRGTKQGNDSVAMVLDVARQVELALRSFRRYGDPPHHPNRVALHLRCDLAQDTVLGKSAERLELSWLTQQLQKYDPKRSRPSGIVTEILLKVKAYGPKDDREKVKKKVSNALNLRGSTFIVD